MLTIWAALAVIFVVVVAGVAYVTLKSDGRYRTRPGVEPEAQGYRILTAEYRSGPEPGAQETSRYWHIPKNDQAYAKIFVPKNLNKD